jgi:UPF0176 protein
MSYIVSTFYKFVALPDCQQQRLPLLHHCLEQGIKGTILLAPEGINGTLVGERAAIDRVLAYLRCDQRLADLPVKESATAQMPFDRMKVKVKREIVTLGRSEVDPTQQVGTYVAPQDWNALIRDPAVLVVDTRNEFEVSIGSFAGAHDPQIQSFRQFPEFVQHTLDPAQHQKIAMFCTGGIRCEKASSYLLAQGFEQVYHLQGGILNYLETVPPDQSLWEGECFVFDQRVSVAQGLQDGSHTMCPSCGYPLSLGDRESPHYEAGISCPHCFDRLSPEQRQRFAERRQQLVLRG